MLNKEVSELKADVLVIEFDADNFCLECKVCVSHHILWFCKNQSSKFYDCWNRFKLLILFYICNFRLGPSTSVSANRWKHMRTWSTNNGGNTLNRFYLHCWRGTWSWNRLTLSSYSCSSSMPRTAKRARRVSRMLSLNGLLTCLKMLLKEVVYYQ